MSVCVPSIFMFYLHTKWRKKWHVNRRSFLRNLSEVKFSILCSGRRGRQWRRWSELRSRYEQKKKKTQHAQNQQTLFAERNIMCPLHMGKMPAYHTFHYKTCCNMLSIKMYFSLGCVCACCWGAFSEWEWGSIYEEGRCKKKKKKITILRIRLRCVREIGDDGDLLITNFAESNESMQ